MTCILQDPEGEYSIWLERVDEAGVMWFEVQVGRTVYSNVPTLTLALELCGLQPEHGLEGLIE